MHLPFSFRQATPASWARALSALAIGVCACLLLLDVRALVKAQFGVAQREGVKTRDLADRHARQLEQDLRLRTDAALEHLDARLASLEGNAASQLTGFRGSADTQLTAALGELANWRTDAGGKIDRITTLAENLHSDAKPVLVNLAATEQQATDLLKDAQDSLDDSYDDMRSLLQSAEVATTQTAQTMQTVNTATPAFLAAAQDTNTQIAGITGDVHDATHNLDVKYFHPPKQGFWGRVKAGFAMVEAFVLAALRGGVF